MSKPSVKDFLHGVQRSRLVPRDRLSRSLQRLKRDQGGALPSDVRAIAKHLIRGKLLTRWQCEKLLAGKSRGFFLGSYRLLDHICTGGMSSVYLAQDVDQKVLRAIKVFPKSRLDHASYLARFHLEAEATVSLDHPNIVQAYGFEKRGDNHFLVMEYVRGRDLLVLVNEDGRLDYRAAADYIAQAAVALEYSHENRVIHRDVKPANLLVNTEGVVKVLDLGLALYKDQESSLTIAHDEKVLGTADYLAPEQAFDSHQVDGRADIYGLGCTLYFALTGHPPFQQGSIAQRIMMHQTRNPPPISQERVDCPDEVQEICAKMMEKKPENRFQSCEEVAGALRSWIKTGRAVTRVSVAASGSDEIPTGHTLPPNSRPDTRRPVRRPTKSPSNDTLASSNAETIVSRKTRPRRALPSSATETGPAQSVSAQTGTVESDDHLNQPIPAAISITAWWLAAVVIASLTAFGLGLLVRFL
jgi:serine/threonine protein kinase